MQMRHEDHLFSSTVTQHFFSSFDNVSAPQLITSMGKIRCLKLSVSLSGPLFVTPSLDEKSHRL